MINEHDKVLPASGITTLAHVASVLGGAATSTWIKWAQRGRIQGAFQGPGHVWLVRLDEFRTLSASEASEDEAE